MVYSFSHLFFLLLHTFCPAGGDFLNYWLRDADSSLPRRPALRDVAIVVTASFARNFKLVDCLSCRCKLLSASSMGVSPHPLVLFEFVTFENQFVEKNIEVRDRLHVPRHGLHQTHCLARALFSAHTSVADRFGAKRLMWDDDPRRRKLNKHGADGPKCLYPFSICSFVRVVLAD